MKFDRVLRTLRERGLIIGGAGGEYSPGEIALTGFGEKIANRQTLCMAHNLMKKNYSQTEAGKKYFIRLYEQAVSVGDQKMINFCKHIFDVYDITGINKHIPRPNRNKK